jgi:type I restriction enzyme S subunit
MTVPVLRFPEFEGEWGQLKLGDIGPVSMCKRVFKDETTNLGDVPFFKIGTFGKEPDAFISREKFDEFKTKFSFPKVGDILISAAGTIGRTVIYDGNDAYFQDSNIVWIANDGATVSNPYLALCYDMIQWTTENTTIARLYNANLKSKKISAPSLPEQKKIAAFLGVVDAKIAALRGRQAGLERYKRGLMQALFNQTLRFTKPDGSAFPDWEEKRLGDISAKNDSGIYKNRELYGTGSNIVGVSDLFSMNAIDGQVFRRVPLDEDEKAKNSLDEGDILYAESSLVRSGIAKAVYVTAKGAGTAFAWHTRRFSVDNQIANSAFIFYYLGSRLARRYIEAVATQTALTGITTKDYFKMSVSLPHPEEQQKIADALSAMDAKITAIAGQVSQMEAFKKGLLQQMFVWL